MTGSFVNERSVEYLLVGRISAVLARGDLSPIPIFFWKTREGGKLAAQGMSGLTVRVLSVFARRPKEPNLSDRSVVMKINSGLFDAAGVAASFGSPVLLGIPIVCVLPEFTLEAPLRWFRLQATADGVHEDVETRVAESSANANCGGVEALSETDLVDIAKQASEMDWESAVHAMGAIRGAALPPWHNRFGPTGYRPLFLVVPSPSTRADSV